MHTVLLGVLDQKVGERTFQANIERRVAMLVGEAQGSVRRIKRATTVGNSSVQVLYPCIQSCSRACLRGNVNTVDSYHTVGNIIR